MRLCIEECEPVIIGSQFVLIYMMPYVTRNVIGSGQLSHVKTHVCCSAS